MGRGMRFRFPVTVVGQGRSDPVDQTSTIALQTPLNVLIIDDNELVLNSNQVLVETLGCHCEIATNRVSAIGMIDSACPDVVFTDLNMPSIDGYQVLKSIIDWG